MLFSTQLYEVYNLLPWVRRDREIKAIRALVEQKRRVYDADKVKADSDAIVSRIEQLRVFQEAKTILLYYPIHNEVDLRPLLEKYRGKKTLLLPVTHRDSIEVRPYDGEDMMRKGHSHIPEPQTETYKGPIDLILVPGVVFDIKRHRIGRGRGYYDRFLSKHRHAVKVGICYEFQLKHRSIPQHWGDRPMDMVVTPRQAIE